MSTTEASMSAIRKAFPSLRRKRPTAIIHSGSRAAVYGCLCGSIHTTSTDWNGRNAKHVREWLALHDDCADELAALVAEGKAAFRYKRGTVGHVMYSMPVIVSAT